MAKLKHIVVLTLLFVFVSWCSGQSNSRPKASPPSKTPTTITDAAGRTHQRAAMRTTHAQRKSVAQRQAKARRAKAAQKKQVTK